MYETKESYRADWDDMSNEEVMLRVPRRNKSVVVLCERLKKEMALTETLLNIINDIKIVTDCGIEKAKKEYIND